jgi:hypothetical protein
MFGVEAMNIEAMNEQIQEIQACNEISLTIPFCLKQDLFPISLGFKNCMGFDIF